ncbi:hypothetical protein N479_26475, partial [Pseudoalteromonas luteoviolacea S4054]
TNLRMKISQEAQTEEACQQAYKQIYDEIDKRADNVKKYKAQQIYYTELSKAHLHEKSYEERLALASSLNGCEFKTAKPYKKAFSSRVHTDHFHHIGNCDGQVLALRRAPGIWLICLFLSVLFFPAGLGFFFEGVFHGPNWLMPAALVLFCIGPWLTYKLWE